MNYYEHHLGDYLRDTVHLSMVEDGAYRRLLDRYYSTEAGIPADQAHRVARARSREEKAAVDSVLAEFFTLSDGVWINGRSEEEIQKAKARINAAQSNGKKGGRPKNREGTQEKPSGFLLGSENETQPKAYQSPDTRQIHSEAKASGAAAPPEDRSPAPATADPSPPVPPDDPSTAPPADRDMVFANGVPLLTAAGVSEKNARSFLAAQSKAHGDAKVADAIGRCAKERPIQPVPWLMAALGPGKSKHAGFAGKDYRAGVQADGSFA